VKSNLHNELEVHNLPYMGLKHPIGGRLAIIKDESFEDLIQTINSEGIEAISLNCARGWMREDVSFLSCLSTIKSLSIISSDVENIKAIENMESLEELELTATIEESIDFKSLKNLKTCYLHWWKDAANIFKCNWLKELYLDELKIKKTIEIEGIGSLVSLEKLVISNSNIKSLEWLSNLTQLKELELINCRSVSDFSEISSLINLKKLQIEGCSKLRDLNFLKALPDLEWLDLSSNGVLPSIATLAGSKKLKALFMTGSTSIEDGDLSFLVDLPKLAILSFTGKKHYTHKLIKKWSLDDLNNPDTLLKLK
jgi:Leucine-rich repeat (LRR) protein